MRGILACALLALLVPTRVVGQGNFFVAGEASGDPGSIVTIPFSVTVNDPGVTAWVVYVCHDKSVAELVSSTIEEFQTEELLAQVSGFSPQLFANQDPQGEGFQMGVTLDLMQRTSLSQDDSGLVFARADYRIVGELGEETDIWFCDDVLDFTIPVNEMTIGFEVYDLKPSTSGKITVKLGNPFRVLFDPTTLSGTIGPSGGTVPVKVRIRNNDPTASLGYFSLGITHDPFVVTVDEVRLGPDVSALVEPDLFLWNPSPAGSQAGVTAGVMMASGGALHPLPQGDYEALEVVYRAVGKGTSTLEFAGGLGAPPVGLKGGVAATDLEPAKEVDLDPEGGTASIEVGAVSPAIEFIDHGTPEAGKPVTVRAEVVSYGSGNATVSLDILSPITLSIPMMDDGQSDDGKANDRIYAGAIPGFAGGTTVQFRVKIVDQDAQEAVSNTISYVVGGTVEPSFRRGDVTEDGKAQLNDVTTILFYIFNTGASRPDLPCLDAGDVDDGGKIELLDVMLLLQFIFTPGSPPPAAPGLTCGPDPNADSLPTCVYQGCAP